VAPAGVGTESKATTIWNWVMKSRVRHSVVASDAEADVAGDAPTLAVCSDFADCWTPTRVTPSISSRLETSPATAS